MKTADRCPLRPFRAARGNRRSRPAFEATVVQPVRPRLASFEAFWPYYLGEHTRPATRALRLFGTWAGLAALGWAVAVGPLWIALMAPVFGYGTAWLSHMALERNRPATFVYPLWSLRADLRMARLAAMGRLGAELRRLGLA